MLFCNRTADLYPGAVPFCCLWPVIVGENLSQWEKEEEGSMGEDSVVERVACGRYRAYGNPSQ
jgi:hypothetical protein